MGDVNYLKMVSPATNGGEYLWAWFAVSEYFQLSRATLYAGFVPTDDQLLANPKRRQELGGQMKRIVFVLGIVLDWHQEWPPRVFSVSPIVRIRQWAPTNAVALSNSPKPWMSSFLQQPVPCSWETTTVPGNLDQRFSRSHSMFWFTNRQRRILYNTALRCYDAMQRADVCFVFECNIVWLAKQFDHTRNRSHGNKVIRLFNSTVWSVLCKSSSPQD